MKQYKKVYIEITNNCNLHCSFCPPTQREKAFMTISNFSDILDKIKPYTEYLYFHVKGEPLLHPELSMLLDISYQKGFKVTITTNGTRLHLLQELLMTKPAIRQINISLQSFEDPSVELQALYMEQVLQFVQAASLRTPMFIELRLWNLEANREKDSSNNKNEFVLKSIETALQLPYELKEEMCTGKGIKIGNRVYLSQSNQFEWPQLQRDPISTTGFCYGLSQQIAVLVDGKVVPCCLDSEGDINLGNIYGVEHFGEILEDSRTQAIIKGFSRRELIEPLCQRCGYRTRFDL